MCEGCSPIPACRMGGRSAASRRMLHANRGRGPYGSGPGGVRSRPGQRAGRAGRAAGRSLRWRAVGAGRCLRTCSETGGRRLRGRAGLAAPLWLEYLGVPGVWAGPMCGTVPPPSPRVWAVGRRFAVDCSPAAVGGGGWIRSREPYLPRRWCVTSTWQRAGRASGRRERCRRHPGPVGVRSVSDARGSGVRPAGEVGEDATVGVFSVCPLHHRTDRARLPPVPRRAGGRGACLELAAPGEAVPGGSPAPCRTRRPERRQSGAAIGVAGRARGLGESVFRRRTSRAGGPLAAAIAGGRPASYPAASMRVPRRH
jgi:hypothetical protein